MNPHNPPSYRHGQISPPTSTTPLPQDHASNSESVRGISPVGTPPITQSVQGLYCSSTRFLQGSSPLSQSATTSHTQPQKWLARHYDGPVMMESPIPMPSSPELVPNQQTRPEDNPKWLEWLRQEKLQELEKEKQKQQESMRTQTPEQHHSPSQQQHLSEQQHYSQPQPDPPQPHLPQRSFTEQQQSFQQRENYSPQQFYSHQRRSTVQQYSAQPHYTEEPYSRPQTEPPHLHQQQRYPDPQQDQYYPPQYHQRDQYQPPFGLPSSRAPTLPMMRQPQRTDTGLSSSTIYMDDYAPRIPRNFPGYQGFPINYEPEQAVVPRTGHRFGKVTVRDNAKVVMGNGIDPESKAEERFHDYGDVDAASLANVHMGNMPVKDLHTFFKRG